MSMFQGCGKQLHQSVGTLLKVVRSSFCLSTKSSKFRHRFFYSLFPISFKLSLMDSSVKVLYRQILSIARSFKDKNFREYFVRITKDDFRNVRKSSLDQSSFVSQQSANLEVLRRQLFVQNAFYSEGFSVKR